MTINSENGFPRAARNISILTKVTARLVALCLILLSCHAESLQNTFENPPPSAKPWTYWFWMNGNISREGITADLEAMSRVGIGGVLIMEVANPKTMAPEGPIAFGSPEWRDLFKHVVSECRRLGMQVNMNNDAGWCGSGGPWIPANLSMQKLVATNIVVQGPGPVKAPLPRATTAHPYYQDVKVLAFPVHGQKEPVAIKEVLDLTAKMDGQGRLSWQAPPGNWNVLRVGVTTTGAMNKPAPVTGQGLECDKFNPDAMKHHFESFIGKLAQDNRRDLKKVFTLTHIDSWEVGDQDWTPRMAREFHRRRGYDLVPWLAALAGGQTVGSTEMMERFRWDFTRTKAELNVEAYAGALKSLAHERGLRLSIEAYNGKGFLNPLTYGAVADLPMAEFWIMRWGAWHLLSPRLMASVGHVHGRPVIGAESFTSWPQSDPWSEHPYSVKTIGDWAFCEGVNHFVFHRTVMDPWTNRVPGMTFAGFGWHVDRNQTWFESGAAYMRYLARCQAMLQAGQFAADVCRLVPAGENFGDPPHMRTLPGQYEPIPSGYNYDYLSDQALLDEVSVRNNRLITKSGMSYAVLQCPNDSKITPQLLRKIRDLVRAGAVVCGPRPAASPSLQNYPRCDEEIRALAREVWGDCDGQSVKQHTLGKGRVSCGLPMAEVLKAQAVPPDFTFAINPPITDESIMSVTQGRGFPRPNEPDLLMPTEGLNWIHRRVGQAEVYFLANPQHRAVDALCTFRVKNLQPETWDPQTGQVRPAIVFRPVTEGTQVPLRFQPAGSCFVVFRHKANPNNQVIEVKSGSELLFGPAVTKPLRLPAVWSEQGRVFINGELESYELVFPDGSRRMAHLPAAAQPQVLSDPWTVRFQAGRGAPEQAGFASLVDWSRHPDAGVRYFSGTAVYSSRFAWSGSKENQHWKLDLGNVQVMAEVTLNGTPLGTLWKPPFEVDITHALKSGENHLEIEVCNLWPNRLIGDEQFPDDCTPNGRWKTGRLPAWPEWFVAGQPRPEPRRLTFSTWKYYTQDSPLKPSGLIGPVRLLPEPYAKIQ